jgi:hypothetical protein
MTRRNRRILVAIVVVVLVAAASFALASWAKGVSDVAGAGKAQLSAAARSLAAMETTAAASQFASASASFAEVDHSLGSGAVASAVSWIPWVGHQYTTTRALARIGSDVSAAGTVLCGVLRGAGGSSEASPSAGFVSVLAARQADVSGALSSLIAAADRASALSPVGLVPPLAKAVTSMQASLREFAPLLDKGRAVLPLMRYLLSSDRHILVISQDGAELRPTGGFPGTFGIVDVGPAGLRLEAYRDVYELPDPKPRVPAPPGALMNRNLSFRDANWWLDFPTSARAMLGFWTGAGQPRVDGMIAIDTVLMQELLATTGPLYVSSYKETFTSANLLDRLLYLVELKKGVGKGVVAALAEALEARVLGAGPSELLKSAGALKQAADSKHLQMYFSDPAAQAAVESLGWSGSVEATSGVTDLLAVSNAMTMPGKVNTAMRKPVAYEVALKADRSADTTLVLSFANTGPFPMPLPSVFRDWLRVYRIPGTVFGAAPRSRTATATTEFGLPAQVRTFTLRRGDSHTETLTARVPGAIAIDPTAASGTLGYRLRIVRQADLVDVPTTVTVTAPAGWAIRSASARFTASGTPVAVTTEGDRVRIAVPLQGDLEFDVRLTAPKTP